MSTYELESYAKFVMGAALAIWMGVGLLLHDLAKSLS
jgi:hypothetical protein